LTSPRSRKAQAFERQLQDYLRAHEGLESFTESLQVLAVHKGRTVYRGQFGKNYRYYDLASLTKILFTTLAVMDLTEQKRFSLKKSIRDLWPQMKGNAQVLHLLTHQAGLDWWQPFYKEMNVTATMSERWQHLEHLLTEQKTKVRAKSVYSDLDLFVLGVLLMKTQELTLLDLFTQTRRRFGLKELFFHPNNEPLYPRQEYAPTELCPWRGRVLRGEVHDENAWSLGGVSTHAGLFGSLDGVGYFLKLIRSCYRGESRKLQKRTLRLFAQRKMPERFGDFGYGFMLPTRGRASCGQHFSPRSFGHTGFTGTSLWYDPDHDFGVGLLSNRVHPHRENRRFLDLRPLLHDWLFENFIE
jgi:CubicO group peptidase (beta-lactamase class C family)